jgi:hypothetical protein
MAAAGFEPRAVRSAYNQPKGRSMTTGQTLCGGLTVIAAGEPFRSSMGDVRQSFGARDAAGQIRSGTYFHARQTYTIHPNHRSTA